MLAAALKGRADKCTSQLGAARGGKVHIERLARDIRLHDFSDDHLIRADAADSHLDRPKARIGKQGAPAAIVVRGYVHVIIRHAVGPGPHADKRDAIPIDR